MHLLFLVFFFIMIYLDIFQLIQDQHPDSTITALLFLIFYVVQFLPCSWPTWSFQLIPLHSITFHLPTTLGLCEPIFLYLPDSTQSVRTIALLYNLVVYLLLVNLNLLGLYLDITWSSEHFVFEAYCLSLSLDALLVSVLLNTSQVVTFVTKDSSSLNRPQLYIML